MRKAIRVIGDILYFKVRKIESVDSTRQSIASIPMISG